jgi:hypothetical protein
MEWPFRRSVFENDNLYQQNLKENLKESCIFEGTLTIEGTTYPIVDTPPSIAYVSKHERFLQSLIANYNIFLLCFLAQPKNKTLQFL